MNLETKRLIISELKEDSSSDILELFSDKEALQYADYEKHTGEEDSLSFIQQCRNDRNLQHSYSAGIHLKSEPAKLIGYIAIRHINQKHRFASISCVLGKAYWDSGIMTEAAEKVISWALTDLGLNRIEGQVFCGHDSSIQMLEKLGFKREGRIRENFMIHGKLEDSYLYSILRKDLDQ